ncbi:xylose isomerase domain protein TIM barrel [Anopheles sinensis]|uniref:Xylose isomerase domain protein TIM barrel n=1 Tax=Anopheles sinensis TaxID=74873 RepID=A0A084VJ91_ANOSI|nr:xylose isomerase domain protein TIM barrel [Anopheles sinensis]
MRRKNVQSTPETRPFKSNLRGRKRKLIAITERIISSFHSAGARAMVIHRANVERRTDFRCFN